MRIILNTALICYIRVRVLESAYDLDRWLFVVAACKLRTVGEERVVQIYGIVLHYRVLHRLCTPHDGF